MSPGFYNHNDHILQTPTNVVMVVETIHDARIISIDDPPHNDNGIRQWLGDSRGHWEGTTLVIETANFTSMTNTRMQIVFGGNQHLRLVERFTHLDTETIDYQYTFENSSEFTALGPPRFHPTKLKDRCSITPATKATMQWRTFSLAPDCLRQPELSRAASVNKHKGRSQNKTPPSIRPDHGSHTVA